MMAVGASIGERIKHLRDRKGMKDTELAKVLHIDRATLKRIIGGDTEKVSSQVIIDAAQHFGVSTDFLLGLTDMPDPMNHPVEEFGLTVPAARAILSEDVHKEMLNRLLENQRFGQLTHTMFYALESNQTEGVMSRDNLLAYSGSLLMECVNPNWKTKRELKKVSRKLGSEIIDALNYLRGCFHVDSVNAFYEQRPEAEKQKALAQKSYEALFDNLDGNYIGSLLAQFEEDD